MRSREHVIRDFVQGWLHKAEADLAAAEILAASEMPDYSTCTFHCQQAIDQFTAQKALSEAQRARHVILEHLETYLSSDPELT